MFSPRSLVFSIECYKSSSTPLILNYSVTVDTLPSFDNYSLVNVAGECTFTVIWLKNPESSIIIFGYESTTNEKSLSSDLLLASVQYQLEGDDESSIRLSHDIQYKCQSSDKCNDETNLKRILNSLRLEENFSDKFTSLIASNQSFNNQSISECYLNRNSTKECSSKDYLDCQRCVISTNFIHSEINEICATCPTITAEYNSIMRDAIFAFSNRSQIVDRVQLSCQNGGQCNSMENIYQIRQASSIDFDFEKYFFSSSSSQIFLSKKFPMIFFLYSIYRHCFYMN